MKYTIKDYFKKYFGVHQGSVQRKLQKSIMFNQAIRLGEDFCYRCGEKIIDIDKFSVDHKEPWIHSANPIGLFYGLDNISFSHSSCNTKAARHPKNYLKNETKSSSQFLKQDKYFLKYLGCKKGKADGILRKSILFNQAVRLNDNVCYRCGKEIYNKDEFSVDHKDPWLYSENPKELYYDLENVSFSHCSCNIKAKRKPSRRFKKEFGLS